MKLLLLLTVLQTITYGSLSNSHLAVRKSVPELYTECRQYLGHRSPRSITLPWLTCENYCAQTVTRIWDGRELRPDRATQFFHTDTPLRDYVTRVKRCIRHVDATVPEGDQCHIADEYFGCFLQPNSTISFEQKFLLLNTDLQQQRAIADCAAILQIPTDEMHQIDSQGLLASSQGRCLVRCFLIREQLYSEAFGADPFRVILRNDQVEHYDSLRDQVIECVANLQRQYLDRCSLAARIAAECYGGQLWDSINECLRAVISRAGNRI